MQPARLAKDLAQFDAVNIGAVGTFVIRAAVSETRLREVILGRLPFRPEMMVCSAREMLALKSAEAILPEPAGKDLQRFVTVLPRTPRTLPHLPLEYPGGERWEVKIVAVTGRFALSIRQKGGAYSNAVVEKLLGMPATTRNWNTFVAIWKALSR